MKDYFLLPDLQYDSYRDTLKEYALNSKDWPSYGIGRFKIYIGRPTRELILPIAMKFKNPKTLFHKINLTRWLLGASSLDIQIMTDLLQLTYL